MDKSPRFPHVSTYSILPQSLKQHGFELLLRLAFLVFPDERTDIAAGGTISLRLYLCFNKSLQGLRARAIQWAYLPHFPG
jgi:hypothetical protein